MKIYFSILTDSLKKSFLLFVFLCIANATFAQVNDQFTDNNFTSNPAWSGDNSKFQVNTLAQLWLNAPVVTDTGYIQTNNSRVDTTEWQFWCKLDFSPSSTNQLRAYLMSDQSNLKSANLNGYYIQMGITGSTDSIQLFEQSGSTHTFVCGGIKGHCGKVSNTLRLRVRRDLIGNWTIWSDTLGGYNWQLECTGFNNVHTTTNYFGFECIYTSTRSDKFYFDDVYIGSDLIDITPPSMLSATVVSANGVDVLFNEDITLNSAQNTLNYTVPTKGNPSSAVLDANNHALVHLTFTSNFNSGNYTITCTNISDLVGNIKVTDSKPFSVFLPNRFDILITELFPDPTPTVGTLPAQEYVELYNNTNSTIDLLGWGISDSSNNIATFSSSFLLLPHQYIIVCSAANASLFAPFGNTITVPTLPSLNNSGDRITVYDAQQNIIHSVFYNDSWYHDNIKINGGWSLELKDLANPCAEETNWSACIASNGGTPGLTNSINGFVQDVNGPTLLNVYISNSNKLDLEFDEVIQDASAFLITNYIVDNGIGQATNAVFTDFTRHKITVSFANNFTQNILYTINVNNVLDCNNNSISAQTTYQFGIAVTPLKNDLLINEILFNPKPDGADFVEIYNASNKIIDLNTVYLAHKNTLGQISNAVWASATPKLILPKQFLVITTDAANIKNNYTVANVNWLIQNTSMPSYNDDEGDVILLNKTLEILDSLHYLDNWHFNLLNDKEGVSLERINFNEPTQDENNWHSAASLVGFATPTSANSQASTDASNNDFISLSDKIISPDNDGDKDYLLINYNMDGAGYVATFQVFDFNGVMITELENGATLAQQGTIKWDGTSNSKALNSGLYILYAQVFNPSTGKTQRYKKEFVVAYKK